MASASIPRIRGWGQSSFTTLPGALWLSRSHGRWSKGAVSFSSYAHLWTPRSHAMARDTTVGHRQALLVGVRTKLRRRGQTRRRWRRIIMQQIVLVFVQVMVLCILASGHAWAAPGKDRRLAKMDHALVVMSDEYIASLAQGSSVAYTSSNPLLRVIAGRVVVDAVAFGDVNALRADLEALVVHFRNIHRVRHAQCSKLEASP
jgi:hypothetical protein